MPGTGGVHDYSAQALAGEIHADPVSETAADRVGFTARVAKKEPVDVAKLKYEINRALYSEKYVGSIPLGQAIRMGSVADRSQIEAVDQFIEARIHALNPIFDATSLVAKTKEALELGITPSIHEFNHRCREHALPPNGAVQLISDCIDEVFAQHGLGTHQARGIV